MFDSIYSIALEILNNVHGDVTKHYDSSYSIALAILEAIGGDVTKRFDSVYSILKEIYKVRFGSELTDMDSVYSIAEAINHALDDTDNTDYDSTYSIILHINTLPILGYKFSINTDSANTVIINGQHMREQYFEEGDEIEWSVSRTGYVTQSGTYTMGDEDYTLDVTLVIQRLTVNITPVPADATVVINGVERSSFTADYGTTINWSVSRDHYSSKTGIFVLYDDTDLTVDLNIDQHTFTISTDSENTVVINGIERTSITADYGTTINWSVSRDHYVTQSGSHTLIADHTENVTLEIQKFTFTINPTPADATVMINGSETSSLSNIPYGQAVVYYVMKTGYITQTDRVVMTSDVTRNISLVLEQHTFTINPTPADAVVTINGVERTSITADYGTTINWSVAKVGYTTQSGTETLTETYSMNINLSVANHTFEIEATPADATVVINGQERTSITAPYGTAISWSVSKSHYITQTGSYNLTGDHYETVTLVADNHTFTINPTPADATVVINGQERTSITAIHGTVANWSVSKAGYVTQSGSYTMNDDYTENVTLVLGQFTVTINPTPADAVVTINGTERSSFTADYGTTINWSAAKTGYISQSGQFTLVDDTTVTPVLVLEQHTFSISTDSNNTVIINGVERSSITTDYGTEITWSVSRTNYTTQSGTYTLTADHTETVVLSLVQYTFTINPTPADATVMINGVAQSSLTADYGTAISWEVSKTGYTTQTGSYTLTQDHTENVTLVSAMSSITFNKGNANVKLVVNGNYLGTDAASHTVLADPGTQIHWEAYRAGYATKKGDLVANGDQTVDASLTTAPLVAGRATSAPTLQYYNGSADANYTISYDNGKFASTETQLPSGGAQFVLGAAAELQKLTEIKFEHFNTNNRISGVLEVSGGATNVESISYDGLYPQSNSQAINRILNTDVNGNARVNYLYLNNWRLSNYTSKKLNVILSYGNSPLNSMAVRRSASDTVKTPADYPWMLKEIHMNCWEYYPDTSVTPYSTAQSVSYPSDNFLLLYSAGDGDARNGGWDGSWGNVYNFMKQCECTIYAYGWTSGNITKLKNTFKLLLYHAYDYNYGWPKNAYSIYGAGVIKIWIDETHYWQWKLEDENITVPSGGYWSWYQCSAWNLIDTQA